jgi:hypothetical protein
MVRRPPSAPPAPNPAALAASPPVIRMRLALPASFLVAVSLLVPAPQAGAQQAPLAVVLGPLAPAATDVLRHALPFHGDHGEFAVVQADGAALAWLARRGYVALALGDWPAGRELAVVERHEVPADAAPLFWTDDTALVSLPAGRGFAEGCLHGATVSRVPYAAPSAFLAPAAVAMAGSVSAGGADSGAEALLATDPRITPLVAQVSQANLLATVTQLSSHFTRRADSTQVLQAKDWLVAQLSAIPGLTVTTQTFDGELGPNVIAEKTGAVHPERVVVLGAHYDSINLSGSTFTAPGADDNASGSAGLLEAARVLAQGDYEHTLRLAWFCAEEFGLLGADAMAEALQDGNVPVVAMLNMDMIAHRDAGDAFDLDFATNNTDAALTQFCRDVTAAYVPTLPTVTGVLSAGSSDHAAFAAHGFPAAFYFEDLTQFSSVIHTSADALPSSPNDFVLARQITQSFVAAAATLASPVDLALAHAPLADTGNAGGPYALAVDAASLTAAGVASVEVRWRVNGGPEQAAPLLASAVPGTWVGALPGLAAQGGQGEVSYWLLATDGAGHQQWLPAAFAPGAQSYAFSVGTITSAFADGFEGATDNGWTHAQVATQDDWQRGVPEGKAGDPGIAAEGQRVWGNDLGADNFNGEYQPNVVNYLESPAIDCTGKTGLRLRYRRWLTVEDALYDQAAIKVNGATVWQNPSTAGGVQHTLDGAWTLHDLDVSALADNHPAVKLRFQLESDGGLEFGGWNIDDLRLASVGPGTVAPLTASALHLSGTGGGAVTLKLDLGPAKAARKYVVAVSASGTAPGTPLGSVTVPLNFDALTGIGLQLLNTPVFGGFGGLLDAQGRASATFVSPPLAAPPLAGLSLHFAAFTLGPIDVATNAVAVHYQP